MDDQALDTATSEVKRVVDELLSEQEPTLESLAAWGRNLPEITSAVVYAVRALREHVLDLGNRFVLTDTDGRPPEEALIETADALRALTTLLERADPSARDYGTSIDKVRVERALEPGEPPSLEVRTSTAADMARRSEPTTHVDYEPTPLMNDTVLTERRRP